MASYSYFLEAMYLDGQFSKWSDYNGLKCDESAAQTKLQLKAGISKSDLSSN